jgi:hypothetical protein
VILRDLHRTFPAHEFFRESNGAGQESLYRLSKAYSLYDEEVSYCQGLSFLAAALLLHMPEEKGFPFYFVIYEIFNEILSNLETLQKHIVYLQILQSKEKIINWKYIGTKS